MKKVAILAAPDALNLETNMGCIFKAQFDLIKHGFDLKRISLLPVRWNDDTIIWKIFDAVMVICVWDYTDDPESFIRVIRKIDEEKIPIINTLEEILFNINKKYLDELNHLGINIMPTIRCKNPKFSDLETAFKEFKQTKLIVKREIGSASRGQHLIDLGNYTDGSLFDWHLEGDYMIQPFINEIQTSGEISVLFINGVKQHAILKRAPDGEYRVQCFYGGTHCKIPLPEDVPNVLTKLSKIPLLARVDYVRLDNGEQVLMEIEMIEPDLFLDCADSSFSEIFAQAILSRISD